VGRRRFTHLHTEVSVAVGELVPRWALWLELEQRGLSPERLTRDGVLAFRERHLAAFLAEHRLSLDARAARRLSRRLARFDPRRPTPEEVLERLVAAT
jgi:hypothetical protein